MCNWSMGLSVSICLLSVALLVLSGVGTIAVAATLTEGLIFGGMGVFGLGALTYGAYQCSKEQKKLTQAEGLLENVEKVKKSIKNVGEYVDQMKDEGKELTGKL